MANGVIAIRGFDYQATIILAELVDHFERHGPNGTVRPEGKDDLDLHWLDGAVARCRHLQVKKPREDADGNRKPASWSLSEVVNELLPGTITRLSANQSAQQEWVLGDEVKEEVRSLVEAAQDAPSRAPEPYWRAIHLLAREATLREGRPEGAIGSQLARARIDGAIPIDPAEAFQKLERDFRALAKRVGADEVVADRYRQHALEFDRLLPDVLARTAIRSTYGSEEEVAARIYGLLASKYSLSRAVVEQTLFRNLRGFINDISKQPGRAFDQVEFELELRSVWPHMVAIRSPLSLPTNFVSRRDLTDRFTTGWSGRAIEIVGTSGSGKTMLASEVIQQLETAEPDRTAYYAEVRDDIRLRDVLAGVAFHLRRLGIVQLFSAAVASGQSEEYLLTNLAHSFSSLPVKALLLIDLVDGTCTPAFARELAIFIRELSPSASCRIAVFGHEGALRQLTLLERETCGVRRLDIRGFSFEEFVALASHNHPNPDRAILSQVYHGVTAGRASGLFAQLARVLADAPSLSAMQDMVARPPDEVLPFAERQRFNRISDRSRTAAEKLVCFALPFDRTTAEQIFPDDNIGAAIKELLELGLLRSRDDGSFEMHEIVRAGLEDLLAPNARQSTHRQLAVWYGQNGPVTARIFHMETAGEEDTARALAREAFLRGEHWGALRAYVEKHNLVSAGEVIQVLAGSTPVTDGYLISDILLALGGPPPVEDLIGILRDQRERFGSDYEWASSIVRAILDFEPSRLGDLLRIVLEGKDDLARTEAALAWLAIGARRSGLVIDSKTIELFNSQPTNIKRMLAPLLLMDWRRDVLRPVFQFLAKDVGPLVDQRKSPYSRAFALRIRAVADTVEFLAALPPVKPALMLLAKSALLGPFAGAVWSERKVLREHCVAIVGDQDSEDAVVVGAIRVLVYLAEPSICTLCDPLLSRSQPIKNLAELVPALLPAACDRPKYEERLLDLNADLQDRKFALSVLAHVGADLGALYRALQAAGEDVAVWDPWFLVLCSRSPFEEAISIVEKRMAATGRADLGIVSALTALSTLPVPSATTMLLRALKHADVEIRRPAAVSLQSRRSRAALSDLFEQYDKEEDEGLVPTLAAAIVASGAKGVADLNGRREDIPPNLKLWKCILVARTRDESYADELVAIACNPILSWQLRRAAIFAAGKLPYELALQRIGAVVLAERSSLTIDASLNLSCHSSMSSVLLEGADGMLGIFMGGETRFSTFFGEIFDEIWQQQMFSDGLPTGKEAAAWLFARLTYHGWPANKGAPDAVINELHVPMLRGAVLRSLRLLGRQEAIEDQIPNADSAWFAAKCLQERSRAGRRDPQMAPRLMALLNRSSFSENEMLKRIVGEVSGSETVGPERRKHDQTIAEPTLSRVSYQDIVQAVSGVGSQFKPSPPLVLEALSAQEYAHLVQLVDPINDPSNSIEKYLPSVQFTPTGYLASHRTISTTGAADPVRAMVRPAVAAANQSNSSIPWHEQLMSGAFAVTYIPAFLACLRARGDSSRFYQELDAHADLLLPYLGRTADAASIGTFVDARIVPTLLRYATTGTDEVFEVLCTLALKVRTADIDPILATLFFRWAQRFDPNGSFLQNDHNHSLWRGFDRLAEHPRFELIEGWQAQLAWLVSVPMSWYRRETIARVLERDPRSYVQVECLLLRATNWGHFPQDEIDRLDAAAEKLFACAIEG